MSPVKYRSRQLNAKAVRVEVGSGPFAKVRWGSRRRASWVRDRMLAEAVFHAYGRIQGYPDSPCQPALQMPE